MWVAMLQPTGKTLMSKQNILIRDVSLVSGGFMVQQPNVGSINNPVDCRVDANTEINIAEYQLVGFVKTANHVKSGARNQ